MKNREYSPQELRNKSEQWCASSEQSESDIRAKLLRLGASRELTDGIIDHLYEHQYLDTARYCRAFVHDKLLYQGWGREKLRAGLRAKLLPSADIQMAIGEIDEEEYNRILCRVAEQKRRTLREDPQAREKLIRFLLQRGFTYSEISMLYS